MTSIHNPFTPKSGIEPSFFVGREKEIDFFKQALKDTEAGKPKHFVIQGDWGSGKTSLLREFKKIAQKEGSLCSMISVRDFEGKDRLRDGIEYLLGEIATRLPLDVSRLQKFVKELSSIGISIAGTGFQFSKDRGRVDPQTLFYSSLLNLWSDLQEETKVLIVLIDDVQNFSSISQIMTTIRQVLTDEKINKETKLLFVLASTYDGWKPFLKRNHPVGRYFTPRMKLENLSASDTDQFMLTCLQNSGVTFSKEVRKYVYHYTQGHLYETHILCNELFESQLKGKVRKSAFGPALIRSLETLGEEVFSHLFESASPTEKQLLRIIAKHEKPLLFSDIHSTATEKYGMLKSNVAVGLDRLVIKRVITKPERGMYSIDDNLFKTFILFETGGS